MSTECSIMRFNRKIYDPVEFSFKEPEGGNLGADEYEVTVTFFTDRPGLENLKSKGVLPSISLVNKVENTRFYFSQARVSSIHEKTHTYIDTPYEVRLVFFANDLSIKDIKQKRPKPGGRRSRGWDTVKDSRPNPREGGVWTEALEKGIPCITELQKVLEDPEAHSNFSEKLQKAIRKDLDNLLKKRAGSDEELKITGMEGDTITFDHRIRCPGAVHALDLNINFTEENTMEQFNHETNVEMLNGRKIETYSFEELDQAIRHCEDRIETLKKTKTETSGQQNRIKEYERRIEILADISNKVEDLKASKARKESSDSE